MIIKDYYLGNQEVNPGDIECLVCDIDGTIADLTHRLHWIKTKPKNYNAFAAGVIHDEPIQWVIDIVSKLHEYSTVILCSGRGSEARDDTILWLNKHGVKWDHLLMRPRGDYRKDSIIKEELLGEIKELGYTPNLVLDDRQQVVDMWRSKGYRTIQVNFGQF